MNANQLKTTTVSTFCAGLLAFTLPPPPSGGFADTESSVDVPVQDRTNRVRRLVLQFPDISSPTSCVQVAFGNDLDHDGTLAPEETQMIFGNDCGEWFVRNEANAAGQVEQLGPTCVFRRGKKDSAWDLARVTMRGRGVEPPVIKAKFKAQGTVIVVR